MRKILAATLLATVAFSLPTTPASASADGCVEQYVLTSDDELFDYPLVTLHPDGSVTVHPNNAVPNALAQVRWARAFVSCVV